MRGFSRSLRQRTEHRFDMKPLFSRLHLFAMALFGILATADTVSAQAPKKSDIEEKVLRTDDGVELKISYFKSTGGKDAPVVILLHGKRGTRLQWKSFAQELHSKRDFAVIAVDLRGHGESSSGASKKAEPKKGDYQAMASLDMEAVRDFMFKEHQDGNLNMTKLGIVACDFSASVALVYTDLDWEKQPYDDSPNPNLRTPRGQDIRALALISPDTATPGLLPSKAANALRNYPIAIMIGASEKNAHDLAASKKLFELISVKREKAEYLYFEKYPEDVRGMDLILQDRELRLHIANFLDKHVRQFESEWRDRRSRLDRE